MSSVKLAVFVTMLVALSSVARAEAWYAQMERSASSPPQCPDVNLVFEMSVEGSQFSGKLKTAVRDYDFSSPIASTGEVSASFDIKGLGTTTVSGNAVSKALELTSSGTRSRGCVFLLKPTTVAPGAIKQWRASIVQVSGNAESCNPGNRGSVTVIGNSLFAFDSTWISPIFGVKVGPDGSADIDTMTSYGRSTQARARVKVVPGSGPREVQYVTYSNACGYKIIPD